MNEAAYDPEYFRRTMDRFRDVVARELESTAAGQGKVVVQDPIGTILEALDFNRVVAEGGADLAALAETILAHSNHLRHPHYMGHQVAVPMLPSVFADMLNGMTNNGMAVYEMGPAQTAIEKAMARWMIGKIGWAAGDGVFTHGGSLGNLTALLAARAHTFPESWREGTPREAVLLVPEYSHYSIERVAAILGLGTRRVVKVPVDDRLRIDPAALERVAAEQAAAGRRVMAVVANAGATANGAVDPLRAIGSICRERGLWLHVDGAHGAAALVSPRHRDLLDGIEMADSLVWDTHKLLGTSALACATLFRDRAALDGAFEQHAPYLFSPDDKPGEDLSLKTFECTKVPLAIKLFFNLALIGEAGLAAHVERLFSQAREFHRLLAARPGFEVFGEPQCNILLFRLGSDSARQDRIRRRLVLQGDFYITQTTVRGEAWLRLVIQN
ncbi:MAG: pyridoxal phosphate-dependent decarboxylase family protein, partial [Verrucomicrobiales bacterium]